MSSSWKKQLTPWVRFFHCCGHYQSLVDGKIVNVGFLTQPRSSSVGATLLKPENVINQWKRWNSPHPQASSLSTDTDFELKANDNPIGLYLFIYLRIGLHLFTCLKIGLHLFTCLKMCLYLFIYSKIGLCLFIWKQTFMKTGRFENRAFIWIVGFGSHLSRTEAKKSSTPCKKCILKLLLMFSSLKLFVLYKTPW